MTKHEFKDYMANLWTLEDLGWHLLPIYGIDGGVCECGRACSSPGKHPKTWHGLRDASNDAATISKWAERWPLGSMAVRTGPESGIVVIDVDVKSNGVESWEDFTKGHEVPKTVTAITGGGGRHYYFEHPGIQVRNRVGTLAKGVDVRGDNGYVLLPGASHLEGVYSWATGLSPWEVSIAALPEWLEDLLVDREVVA